MTILARIKPKDEQPAAEPVPATSDRTTLTKIRGMAALAAARFQLDHDAVALSDVVDLIVVACNKELAP